MVFTINKQTTVTIDEKIHALAIKHGINLSGTCRRAIEAKVEQAERAEREVLQNG